MSKKRKPIGKSPVPEDEGGRLTYRDLRNTPGRVWERLANDQPLTLVADGVPRAVVIPINDGDAQTVIESYRRGRALLAMSQMQAQARKRSVDRLSLADINKAIRDVRRQLRDRDADG